MLCRATNALISVRLDYNNLRKKYRNFWFLFCSFIFFFNCLYLSPPKPARILSFYLSDSLSFSPSILLSLSHFFHSLFSHLVLHDYKPWNATTMRASLPAKRIAKICRAENGIIVRHYTNK